MGLITDLGVEGGGILHPQQKNRWAIAFLGLPSTAHELRLQAITVDRPKMNFEKITLDRYNTRAFIAGKYTWETVNAVFEADIGGQVAAAIQGQLERQQQIIGPGAAPTLPAAPSGDVYKFAMNMEMHDGDAPVSPIELWVLEGCWLENVDWGDLDYSTGETVKITTTISFDHARQIINGVSGNATGGAA